jgi:hypothetical protein|uniref:Uncharacterized protein n=1 Tax=Fagus sylvatica TaxID=28930 RepID=A0A2N9J0M8_FAGSY
MNTNTRAKKPEEKQPEDKKLEEKKRSILLRVLLFVALTMVRSFIGAFGEDLFHHSKVLRNDLWKKLLILYEKRKGW